MPGNSTDERRDRATSEENNEFSLFDLFTGLEYMGDETETPTTVRVESINDNRARTAILHHTNGFNQNKYFVVRRGQEFIVGLTLNRELDTEKDDLKLVFQFGKSPNPAKKTEIQMILSDDDVKGQWGAKIVSKKDKLLKVSVITPPDCFVGKWKMIVDTVVRDEEKIYRYEHKDPVYVLFNPWCKDDTVYMEGENERDQADKLIEYVLRETGRMYYGSTFQIGSMAWNFGQFEDVVLLDCVIYLLDEKFRMNDIHRGNPIYITRRLSALVNMNDGDGGIIWGNWSGDYEGGKSPTKWSGSVKIVDEYMRTKEAVRYGQCWVFSGVTTTLCRALGIPTRSVTNFDSAHDTDGSTTIDYFFTKEMEKINGKKNDSIWNFHVWNEVYFTRPDLPSGYGGWQVVDATPQEASNGVMCMGPCSIVAVKKGDMSCSYDGPFLFAEVNSDVVEWVRQSDRTWIEFKRTTNTTGFNLSTNAVGSNQREDVTHLYKYREGSTTNRSAVDLAAGYGEPLWKTGKVVGYWLLTDLDTYIGETIKMVFKVKNYSEGKRTIQFGKVNVRSVYQKGVVYKHIETFNIPEIKLDPHTEETLTMNLGFDVYISKLTDFYTLKMDYFAKVAESSQRIYGTETLCLKVPHLSIKGPAKVKLNETFSVEVSLGNPLDIALTNCSMTAEGPGFSRFEADIRKVEPKADCKMEIVVKAKKIGKTELIINFHSAELQGLDEAYEVEIEN